MAAFTPSSLGGSLNGFQAFGVAKCEKCEAQSAATAWRVSW